MKQVVTLATLLLALGCGGCGETNTKRETERLQQMNDSLLQASQTSAANLDTMLSLMNEVEDGFRTIRESENYLTVSLSQGAENNSTQRERITNDMNLVMQTLQRNREKLAQLQQQLAASNHQSAQLQASYERLLAENEERVQTIIRLQEELALRDTKIENLSESLRQANQDITQLNSQSQEQSNLLDVQEASLNRVWYVVGNKDELKEQQFLTGGSLFKAKEVMQGDYNADYLTEADKRTLTHIPLFDKKAKLLTNHPKGSYALEKDEKKLLTLHILDAAQFWSLSPYLVVEVD